MEPRARARWKKVLTERRAELVAAGPNKIEPNRKDTATTGIADEDEQALSEMLQTLSSARNRDGARTLSAIDAALAKLHNSPEDFGVCEECGEDVPARRLEVMPWASLCTECQSKLDPRRNVARKKITDYR